MSQEWLLVIGFLAVLGWQIVSKSRETRQRNRWIRTSFDMEPRDAEKLIDAMDKTDAERFWTFQGKP